MITAISPVSSAAATRLPSNVDQSAVTCTLTADGLLTLYGPKTGGIESGRGDRTIPVTREDKSNLGSSS